MAKYIKKEMVDLHHEGQTIYTYRMQTLPMDNADFIKDCARNTTFSEGEIIGVIGTIADCLAQRMARGYSVTIEGLGTFKAQVGLSEDFKRKQRLAKLKGTQNEEGDDTAPRSRNARSLEVTGVLWKPAKSLVRDTRSACRLERGGEELLRKSKYTYEERLARARAFMEKNTVMRVSDYARLTGLSHTKAAAELRSLDNAIGTGINPEAQETARCISSNNKTSRNHPRAVPA